MARGTKADTKPASTESTSDESELEFEHYLDKDPSETHKLCADWMEERTGYEMDLKTVQLVLSLYGKFQRSPENVEFNEEKKARALENKAAREQRAAERAEKSDSADEKPVRRSSRKVATAEDEAEEAPARATRGRRAAAAKTEDETPAPARRTSRRRPAAKAESADALD